MSIVLSSYNPPPPPTTPTEYWNGVDLQVIVTALAVDLTRSGDPQIIDPSTEVKIGIAYADLVVWLRTVLAEPGASNADITSLVAALHGQFDGDGLTAYLDGNVIGAVLAPLLSGGVLKEI